jgi:hypothetical protein
MMHLTYNCWARMSWCANVVVTKRQLYNALLGWREKSHSPILMLSEAGTPRLFTPRRARYL